MLALELVLPPPHRPPPELATYTAACAFLCEAMQRETVDKSILDFHRCPLSDKEVNLYIYALDFVRLGWRSKHAGHDDQVPVSTWPHGLPPLAPSTGRLHKREDSRLRRAGRLARCTRVPLRCLIHPIKQAQ